MPESAMKQHPSQLGKYPITGVLGEGAMGVVYQGVDPVIGRAVAIKTIHRQLVVGDDDSASSYAGRFRNEAQAVGRLSHPGIVQIYEYGEDGDVAFIAMEFVQGRTLSQLLASTALPQEATIVRVMSQLLDALDCAHRAGVWHRDVKPANIIITDAGQLKLTDFGIARIEAQALTRLTSVVGTPGYIAPEQYTGHALDHRIDIFAAGVLLYRMLTGNSPFSGTPEASMYKTVNEDPLAPSQATGGKRSAAFDAVVARALAKKPQDRFADAADFRRALLEAGQGTSTESAPLTQTLPLADARTLPTSPSGGLLRQAGTIGGWDVSALAPIELALASLLGPMAKLLVRQAAQTSSDLPTLTRRVAEHIADPAERADFVRRVSASSRMAAGAVTTPPTPTPLTDPGGPLPSAVIGHALKVLTSHIGPIARIVVKGAAGKARSVPQFYTLLAEEMADSVDSCKLMKQLMAVMG
ncbi:serine/threonine-protein kinase [Piscinibacter terrae]|uniref:Serine/threonine protein kinase n=1 Tax=Piscinibacter terrae TaxID=2496871 RepID=A0A3N7HIU0_9BURK|nr:serine/threonine-protein kinase [Albitalea terrae]RQP21413.1 serine/threonine protein kinase [Albitalea terrae]